MDGQKTVLEISRLKTVLEISGLKSVLEMIGVKSVFERLIFLLSRKSSLFDLNFTV